MRPHLLAIGRVALTFAVDAFVELRSVLAATSKGSEFTCGAGGERDGRLEIGGRFRLHFELTIVCPIRLTLVSRRNLCCRWIFQSASETGELGHRRGVGRAIRFVEKVMGEPCGSPHPRAVIAFIQVDGFPGVFGILELTESYRN